MFEVPKDIPAEAARDVETALKNFFESRKGKRKGKKVLFPRKKKKGKSKDTFRLPSEVVVVKESSIGLDLGIKSLVTYSNGVQKEGPKSLKKKEKKLNRLSRRLSKKHVPGKLRSRNAIKAANKIASLHMRITNIRKDFREKETTRLARKYDLVCVESLNVQGMVKNRRLAKSISDQSFGAFVATLERKQEKTRDVRNGSLESWDFLSFIKAMSKVRG
jgi:IS605 OrfB family transposase